MTTLAEAEEVPQVTVTLVVPVCVPWNWPLPRLARIDEFEEAHVQSEALEPVTENCRFCQTWMLADEGLKFVVEAVWVEELEDDGVETLAQPDNATVAMEIRAKNTVRWSRRLERTLEKLRGRLVAELLETRIER